MEKFYTRNPFTGTFDPVSRWDFDTPLTFELSADAVRYIEQDLDSLKDHSRFIERTRNNISHKAKMDMIQKVIFNPPATIVFWRDGSKTVVKCGENDVFDPEKGLAMAISKRAFGDNRDYYEVFAKWVGKYEYQQKRKEKRDERQ